MEQKILDSILEDETMGHTINSIENKEIKDFVLYAIKTYGDTNKLNVANEVSDELIARFTKKKQIGSDFRPAWMDVMTAAALIHNLFYDGTLPSVFMAREKLAKKTIEYNMPINAASAMFLAVESQLGDDMPVESCIPQPGSPNGVFADACWQIEERHGNKKLPDCKLVA